MLTDGWTTDGRTTEKQCLRHLLFDGSIKNGAKMSADVETLNSVLSWYCY